MQSWGTQSRFTRRDTGLEPSKSGVVGLLCAALGRPRPEPLDDLAAMRMGVRVDREGRLEQDYHTAGGWHRRDESYGVARADGGLMTEAVLSHRQYLAGADFLVDLEGEPELLRALDRALARPVWQLFLGRKGFAPGLPVRLPDAPPLGPGLRDSSLRDALLAYPWPEDAAGSVRFVWDAEPGEGADVRADVPLSFALGDRRYAARYTRTEFISKEEATS
jgi:CRISPR system Cascade subunit CasD